MSQALQGSLIMSIKSVSAYNFNSATRGVARPPVSVQAQQIAVRSLGNTQVVRSSGLGQEINASTQSTVDAAYGRASDYVSRTGNNSVRSSLSGYLQSTSVNATSLGTRVDTSA
jgi:hypothetical protein